MEEQLLEYHLGDVGVLLVQKGYKCVQVLRVIEALQNINQDFVVVNALLLVEQSKDLDDLRLLEHSLVLVQVNLEEVLQVLEPAELDFLLFNNFQESFVVNGDLFVELQEEEILNLLQEFLYQKQQLLVAYYSVAETVVPVP